MKAYKIELDLNNKQCTACLKHAGTARWAYNWGLSRKIKAYKAGEKTPSAVDLHRELNVLKKVEVPWMYEVSKCAPQEALRNLDTAFSNFFRRCTNNVSKKGYPRFKSRRRGIGSFTLTGLFDVSENSIRLPRLGWLRLKERGYLPTNVRIVSATVSERAGRWFVAVRTKEEPHRERGEEVIGVDVGVKDLAVLSDGTCFENPKALGRASKRLRLLQKSVSRKHKGSSNRKKARARLARQHYRVSCIRSDMIHKATAAITKRAAVIGIETLNISGMLKNHCLARVISDASLGELLRQIKYKAAWGGATVVCADRWFPSSKMCSVCGYVLDELALSVRHWTCPTCGAAHDRDINAAINLKNMAVSSTVTACGEISSGSVTGLLSETASMKQEPNTG